MTKDLTFSKLGIEPGRQVLLAPQGSDKKAWPCLYVGCLPDTALMITANDSGEFPVLHEGQKIALKVALPKDIVLLSTTVLCISETPVFMVYLDYPHEIRAKQIRNASRIEIQQPAIVSDLKKQASLSSPGKILDISVSGARIELDNSIAKVEDYISVRTKFTVNGVQRVLDLKAAVKSVSATKKNTVHYGVQFEFNDEDNLLILMGFLAQHSDSGKVQIIR